VLFRSGFTKEITFEGQAAMWLEHIARDAKTTDCYPFPFVNDELDFRPLLQSLVEDRVRGRAPVEIARAFQRAIAQGLAVAVRELAHTQALDTVVCSGGVFQNEMLLEDLKEQFRDTSLQIWTNQSVPANDGGISLGQAALAALHPTDD
jgi:hydrogenase maturation protein HypF